ncbi:AraC family transcriptional regulator [Sporosarcina sp. FSL K6-2383]|uniref:AraC family transcriptional regulator n=1 Tax=Sporosarcina sp. FSL K6-2383 TaxID=2921556 RepID=UPI003159A414
MNYYWEKAECHWSEDSVRLISTPSAEARSAFFYIQEIGHFKTFYPFFTERQHLDSYLIVHTLSGNGQLTYNNTTYSLGPGELFFIDCNNYQLYQTSNEDSWEILWIHIKGSTTAEYYKHYSKSNSPVSISHQESQVPYLIQQLIQLHQLDKASLKTEIISSKLILNLLTEVLLNSNELNKNKAITPDYIEQMKTELEVNFDKKITLTQLSRLFAVNKYQLAKEFKHYIGITPNEYLINRRITKAKDLLKNTNLTISSISFQVGIDNVSHFINLFKDRVDSTPLSFRKHWQNGWNDSKKAK